MKVKLDLKDHTATKIPYDGRLYFLRGQYADGYILGFYSDKPCGRTQDQERGWVLICPEPETIITDIVETYNFGPTGLDNRKRMREWRAEHGKLTPFRNTLGGIHWKMGDC